MAPAKTFMALAVFLLLSACVGPQGVHSHKVAGVGEAVLTVPKAKNSPAAYGVTIIQYLGLRDGKAAFLRTNVAIASSATKKSAVLDQGSRLYAVLENGQGQITVKGKTIHIEHAESDRLEYYVSE